MKDEAEKLGWQLVYTDAAGSAAKQVADVNSMIAQGVDAIFLSPREEKPLIPAVMAAKKAGIPLFLIDRSVDANARQGRRGLRDLHRLGLRQGRHARRRMAWSRRPAARRMILEIEGSTGSSPANDRKKGFDDVIAKNPDMKIIASQTGDFARDKGRKVAEALLQAHPEATVIYAHNDEMAIGAICGHRSGRQGARQGHPRRLDRRRKGRPAGDHRRQDGLHGRMQSEVRAGRLRCRDRSMPRAKRSRPS